MIDLIIDIIGFAIIFFGLDLYRVEKFKLFSFETLAQIIMVYFGITFMEINFLFLSTKIFFWVLGFILLMVAKDYKRKESEIYPPFSKETFKQIFMILLGSFMVIS